MSSSTNSTGTVASSPTAGYATSRLFTKLAAAIGDTTAAARTDDIYDAITTAGWAAETWRGENWWWLYGRDSFSTTDGTASYALRTEIDDTVWSVISAYYDEEWPLNPMDYKKYDEWYTIVQPDQGEGKPERYAIIGEPPYMWFSPVPDATYTVNVLFKKRHSKITASTSDGLLLVPSEFQDGVYFTGALWLLRHDITETGSLERCDGFVEAMDRMYQNQPVLSDRDPGAHFTAETGQYPHNQPILGGMTVNNGTI